MWSLSAMTLLLWTGGTAIVPLLPPYLKSRGQSSATIGAVMAAYFALAVLTQYPIGRLSDRIGRRNVVVAGIAVFIIGSLGFAAFSGALLDVLARALQGIGTGAVTVASAAALAEHVEVQRRGRAFAVLYGSQSLGLAIGPLVGSAVGSSSMRLLFVAGAAFGAAAGVVGAVFVPSRALGVRDRPAAPALAEGEPQNLVRMRAARRGAVVAFAAIGLPAGLYESCWSLLLHARGATSFEIGLSWTLYCLPFALLSAPAGRWADRVDRRSLAAFGVVSSAIFALVYPTLHAVLWLVGLGCLEACGAVLVTPAALSLVSEWTAADRYGATQGTLETSRTASTAVGAAGCGALYGVGLDLPFVVVSALLLTCAVALVGSWRGLPGRVRRRVTPVAS